jgi:hypothetical protein
MPMQPPLQKLQDDLTTAFEALQATCKKPEAAKHHLCDWVSEGTRLLIKQRTSLHQLGRLCWCMGQCTQFAIYATLKVDCTACTSQVGNSIVADLAEGNVKKVFCHVKGWYQVATESQAWPCFHTMERQTAECVDLYQQHNSLGHLIAINIAPVEVRDDVPVHGEIRAAVAELTNGHSAGAFRMQTEHLKEWLWGIKLEEDAELAPSNVGTVDQLRALAWLVQAILDECKIPIQLWWVVTVLIPKDGGDYPGISLLKPIWKVMKWVMDHQLNVIALHNSLHSCWNGQGTSTAMIEAKLTLQIAHIEQAPF